MAGQTIVNFDGLSADAAEKLSLALVEGAKGRIREAFQQATEASRLEPTQFSHVERLLLNMTARLADGGGGCGIGCC